MSATACGGAQAARPSEARPVRIRVSGSSTALPLLQLLGSEQPDERLELSFLPGMYTQGGIQGVKDGSIEMGAISRDLTPQERSDDLLPVWLSKDALLIATHPSVGRLGVRTLSRQQLKDIYAGRITDWKQLGARQSLAIIVLDREEDTAAKRLLREKAFGNGLTVTPEAVALYYETDMVKALTSTPGAVGYFSLGYAVSGDIAVNKLRFDGVDATLDTVKSGAYPLTRPLGFVVRKKHDPAIDRFIVWTRGKNARSLMAYKGYAPYTK
jgi:phosphate transport system substrate-binding protein